MLRTAFGHDCSHLHDFKSIVAIIAGARREAARATANLACVSVQDSGSLEAATWCEDRCVCFWPEVDIGGAGELERFIEVGKNRSRPQEVAIKLLIYDGSPACEFPGVHRSYLGLLTVYKVWSSRRW